ncbi:hypothetical protein NIES2104_64220 [Leptolyngbya sp. NIES-2104]|nr:hypothetical protein NIES2104_64220 [Leptolyngbya sp. NIES-2104]
MIHQRCHFGANRVVQALKLKGRPGRYNRRLNFTSAIAHLHRKHRIVFLLQL